jgi:hypothetical protein
MLQCDDIVEFTTGSLPLGIETLRQNRASALCTKCDEAGARMDMAALPSPKVGIDFRVDAKISTN